MAEFPSIHHLSVLSHAGGFWFAVRLIILGSSRAGGLARRHFREARGGYSEEGALFSFVFCSFNHFSSLQNQNHLVPTRRQRLQRRRRHQQAASGGINDIIMTDDLMRPVGIVLLVSSVSLYAALISYATARGRQRRKLLRRAAAHADRRGQSSSHGSSSNNSNNDPEQQQ
jgi:hypothetical protein